MTRRLLLALAFLGMVGAFASAIRDLYRIAETYCGTGEAGGNCRAFADLYARTDIKMFAVFAVAMAILLLLPSPLLPKWRLTDK